METPMPHMEADTDAPVPVELDFVAHALLGGLRAHAVGHGDCGLVKQRLSALCGSLAEDMDAAILLVVRLLALRSRRRLRVHLPHCSGLSGDEMMWLAAVADGQGRGAPQLRSHSWMTRLAGVFDPGLEWAVAEVARVLARSGRRLAPPAADAAFHDAAIAPTVH
jgi:hypothetical protein